MQIKLIPGAIPYTFSIEESKEATSAILTPLLWHSWKAYLLHARQMINQCHSSVWRVFRSCTTHDIQSRIWLYLFNYNFSLELYFNIDRWKRESCSENCLLCWQTFPPWPSVPRHHCNIWHCVCQHWRKLRRLHIPLHLQSECHLPLYDTYTESRGARCICLDYAQQSAHRATTWRSRLRNRKQHGYPPPPQGRSRLGATRQKLHTHEWLFHVFWSHFVWRLSNH